MIWETLTVEVTDRLAVVTVNRPRCEWCAHCVPSWAPSMGR